MDRLVNHKGIVEGDGISFGDVGGGGGDEDGEIGGGVYHVTLHRSVTTTFSHTYSAVIHESRY